MDTVIQDLRYAARSLLRSPGLLITALVTLSLGIGANTALFSTINGVFLKPHPAVGEADELYWVSEVSAEWGQPRPVGITYPIYDELRKRPDLFEGLTAFRSLPVSFSVGAEPEQLLAEVVAGGYFQVLQVDPALGRGFLPEENAVPGTHPVAVIGHDLWQTRFGGSSDVVGREAKINGATFTVVGVAPDGFRGLRNMERPADLWVPLMMHPVLLPNAEDPLGVDYGTRSLFAAGRLAEGVAPAAAVGVMTGLIRGMESEYPQAYRGTEAQLYEFRGVAGPRAGSDAASMLLLAGSITLIVLVIACANLANLLLARAATRRREIAIRSAVGASRWRIVRQLLVESILLSVSGGVAAILVAGWMVELYTALAPIPFPVPIAVDAVTLLITMTLAVATGILAGISPALRISRAGVTSDLKGLAGRAAGRIRPQTALVAGQLALSCVLLVGAGLVVRSMWEIVSVDRQQPARNSVLALTFDLGTQGYTDDEQRAAKDRILEQAAAIPEVESVTLSSTIPYEISLVGRVAIEAGGGSAGDEEGRQRTMMHYVRPHFLRTIGVPLLRGRDFTSRDREGAPVVVLVNETAARRWWPGEDALGRHLRVGPDSTPWATVVGVVADARYDESNPGTPGAAVYVSELVRGHTGPATLLARTRGDAMRLRDQLTTAIHRIEPDVPVYRVRTLGEMIDERWADGWIAGGLMVGVGALALFLALIGLHGVVAYTVQQRRREVGVRVSLGASRLQILRLFAREVLRFAGAGIAAGLLLSAALAAILRSMLAELEPLDLLTFSVIAALLLGVVLTASYFPARRATRVDPMEALRAE